MSEPTIQVQQTGTGEPMEFSVIMREGTTETRHQVTMKRADYDRLTGGTVAAGRCIQAAFEFLLDHEPKESILGGFDVSIIATYFPSFPREIARYF